MIQHTIVTIATYQKTQENYAMMEEIKAIVQKRKNTIMEMMLNVKSNS
jgi:hypothetical protein